MTNQPENSDNQLVKPTAGNTLIWDRTEKNIIYLMSEFIDNSKASYEAMNNKIGNKTIEIEFNAYKNFIAFRDEAQGFEIFKAIQETGRNKKQQGKTNQYFIGMKSAMNYFGDFSIIISERLIDGVSRRFANYYIYYNGFYKYDVELESNNKTGSSIYLFASQNDTNAFWNSLPFKNINDRHSTFPKGNTLDVSEFVDYSVTETVLNGLDKYFPIITASLFERYSPLVNKNPDLIIKFKAIGVAGNNLLLLNKSGFKTPSKTDNFPIYYNEIKANDWETDRSFSFSNFFNGKDKEDNQTFRKNFNNLESNNFRKIFEDLLYVDVKRHFSKFKDDINLDDLERKNIGNLPDNIEFLDYPDMAGQYKFVNDDKWNRFSFAKKLMAIFLSKIQEESGTLSHFKFKINNLIIDEGRNIIVSNNIENNNTFSLTYDLNIFGTTYQHGEPKYQYGKLVSENETGLSVIQDDRAIYHGPNYNTLSIKVANWPSPWPEKLMVKDLKVANPKAFPSYQPKSNYPTNIGLNGDQVKWPSRLFGSISIPHSANFIPGRNKSQTHNLELIQEFTLKILRDLGINVLIRWIYLIDNGALTGKPTTQEINEYNRIKSSKRETKNGLILLDILQQLSREKKEVENDFNYYEDALKNVNDNHLNKIINNLEENNNSFNENIFENNQSEVPWNDNQTVTIIPSKELELSPIQEENQIVLKSIFSYIRGLRNNVSSILRPKKITLDNDEQTITMDLDRAFTQWKQSLIIHFDSNLMRNEWQFLMIPNQPLKIVIPFDTINWHRAELIDYLNKQWLQIYSVLINASCFFKLITIKKNSKLLSEEQNELAIATYLNQELSLIIETNNRAYENLSKEKYNSQIEIL